MGARGFLHSVDQLTLNDGGGWAGRICQLGSVRNETYRTASNTGWQTRVASE